MRLIMFLFVVTFALAENNSLIKVNDSYMGDFILLKGEKENCVINFLSTLSLDINTTKTTCIKSKNSKKINIFCTKNKEICKTEAEVSYFRATGKKFPQKRSTKAPFIGTVFFTFTGAIGGTECAKINKKGLISFGYVPLFNEEEFNCDNTKPEGKWDDKYNPYWIDKNAVCKLERGNVGLCISLDIDEVTK